MTDLGRPGRGYVSARDVELGYVIDRGRGYFTACKDLSFDIARGDFVAVVGRSGAGKTSLLLALQGLVDLHGGSLEIAGRPVAGPSPDRGVVFQDASLFPWLTVRRNILFGLGRRRRDKEAVRRVDELIEIVGLTDFADAHPSELSGGMQQRVNLARALAIDPDVILLDEPFSALDPQTRSTLQTELTRIWQDVPDRNGQRRTAVFVTHDLVEAVYLADQVIVMTPGPARIRAIVDVELPRPRSHDAKRGSELRGYVDRIAELMEAGDELETSAELGAVAR